MIELLAPAGSMEALRAAVESGADAIYLAGKMFGARAYADNFDEEGMKEAIEYAHVRNVKINVTVNTLVDNSEIEALADYLRFLYEVGVDAVLVQDLGAARLAKQIVPNMPLHASTQMTVNNLAGVQALAKLGFTRVVLAREVTLEDIRHICKNTDIEIEVFGHGAICVCYSGQCLMSSMIGGRSGNRGRCAQPCRLPYNLEDKQGNILDEDAGKFLLSPKDMNTIELVPELIEAGVASLKLEGRMKKPEYVAIAVDAYRQKIDNYYYGMELKDDINKNLSQIFNRDFTTAYLEKHQGKLMMSDKRPNNRGRLVGRVIRYDEVKQRVLMKLVESVTVGDTIDFWVKVGGRVSTNVTQILVKGREVETAQAGEEVWIPVAKRVHPHDRVFKVFDVELTKKARSFFTSGAPVRRLDIDITVRAKLGENFKVIVTDQDGYYGEAEADFLVEEAKKRAIDYDMLQKQMGRLGTTIYSLNKLTCNIDDNVMVPVSVMNETRRMAIESIMEQRLAAYYRPPVDKKLQPVEVPGQHRFKETELVVAVATLDKLKIAVENGADVVLFGGDSYNHKAIPVEIYVEAVEICHKQGVKIAFGTPRIMRDKEQKWFENWLGQIKDIPVDMIYANSLAQMHMIKEHTTIPIWADYSFNTYNDVTLNFLLNYGIIGANLSPELNFKQLKVLANKCIMPVECVVHGYTELMVSEYCVLGSFLGGLDKGPCSQPCTKNSYHLRDRKNEIFPIVTDQFCHMHLLNGKVLNMLAHVTDFQDNHIDRIRIDGRNLTDKELARFVKVYKEILNVGKGHPIFQGDNILPYENNMTRGHYFRGVE